MGKVKVHHILYSGLGGPGNVFLALIATSKESDCIYSAAFCGIEPLRGEYGEACEKLAVPYEYIRKKPGFHPGVYRSVYNSFRKQKPTVILLHGVSFILPAIVYRLFHPGTKVAVRDTQAHHLKTKLEWIWLFLCTVFANRIIVLTEESGNGISKRFGFFSKRKTRTISNGLDTELYCPNKIDPTAVDLIRIGMQSRLQPIKDHSTLLKAFKLVKQALPNRHLQLEIAGDGITRAGIEKEIQELGIADAVVMHGMLDTKELVPFMQSLDIYVHATFGETLSNSIMQAMACGLPIIASDVWGVNNMIQNGVNGFLYVSKNDQQLAVLLQDLIINNEKRQAAGHNARQFALVHYSNKAMAEKYRELFKDLAKR